MYDKDHELANKYSPLLRRAVFEIENAETESNSETESETSSLATSESDSDSEPESDEKETEEPPKKSWSRKKDNVLAKSIGGLSYQKDHWLPN